MDIRWLSDRFAVAPQIAPEDMAAIATMGFGLVVNNRPDGEVPGQPDGATMEAAAHEAGLGYLAVPVDHSGFSAEQIAALGACLVSPKPVLAYCRSGTRSAMLWALAAAARGDAPETVVAAAAEQGYDIRPLADAMRRLSPGE